LSHRHNARSARCASPHSQRLHREDDGTNIRSVDSKPTPDGNAIVDFVIETVDVRHLNRLVLNLRKVPGVREVHRVQKI
jgi:GTP pyrophosphokinase